jgi:hypothetical protein
MSPSLRRPVARRARADHCGPNARRPTRPVCLASAIAVAIVILAGCSSSSSAPQLGDPVSSTPAVTASGPSPAVSSSPTMASAQGLILSQYGGFWQALPGASRAASSRRRALLSKYAGNPELRSLLVGMARQDREDKVIYGFDKPHATVRALAVSRGLAVISDCQNSSDSGVASRSTGRRLTVGVKRNHIVSTMHLGADGVWRVSFVAYPKTPC